jgi:hypothetical protein
MKALSVLLLLAVAACAYNWDIEGIAPNSATLSVAIALDGTKPLVAFGFTWADSAGLGFARRTETGWVIDYPYLGSPVDAVSMCLDSTHEPHVACNVSCYPAPEEVHHCWQDSTGWHDEFVGHGHEVQALRLAIGPGDTLQVAYPDTNGSGVKYARRLGSGWEALDVPAASPGPEWYRKDFSLAVDAEGRPGIAVGWNRPGPDRDSLFCQFFWRDSGSWHEHDVHRIGINSWEVFSTNLRFDSSSGLFHLAYCTEGYATGHDSAWQVKRETYYGENMCGFTVFRGHPYFAASWPVDALFCQWYDDTIAGWYSEDVGAVGNYINPDIAVDSEGRQYIAFVDPTTGLGYARRKFIGGLGLQEEAQSAPRARPRATIVRRMLFLPEATSRNSRATRILDANGRKVMNLKPGTNDVRELAPGVYFIREAQAVRKIVLTE